MLGSKSMKLPESFHVAYFQVTLKFSALKDGGTNSSHYVHILNKKGKGKQVWGALPEIQWSPFISPLPTLNSKRGKTM